MFESISIVSFGLAYFLFLIWIAFQFVGSGSDHYFYAYYIDIMRGEKKFLRTYPNILNTVDTVDPQLVFKFFSFFDRKHLKKISLLLNPILMTTVALLVPLLFKGQLDRLIPLSFAGIPFGSFIVCLLLALTPQYFCGNNSRIYGLSMRGFGVVLICGLFICIYFYEIESISAAYLGAILVGYLIWQISLFAQQGMILFGLILGFGFKHWTLLEVTGISALLFLILQPSYAWHFFKARLRYWYIYARYLAPRFLWTQRYSIWRDLFFDFWFSREPSLKKRAYYLYSSPLFLGFITNPLALLILIFIWKPSVYEASPLLKFSFEVGVSSVICMAITSFRWTRFLGEPERYIELAIPFTTILGISFLTRQFGLSALWILFILFGLMNIIQIYAFVFVANYGSKNLSQDQNFPKQIPEIVHKIEENSRGLPIRFIASNGDWTKILMNDRWSYVLFWPTAFSIAGISIEKFMPIFPLFEKEQLEYFVEHFKINYCLLDKKNTYSTLFANASSARTEIIADHPLYILLKIYPEKASKD